MATNSAFGDDFFDSIFNDAGDLDTLFQDNTAKEQAVEPEAEKAAEAPAEEAKVEPDAVEATEDKLEQDGEETIAEAKEPEAEQTESTEEQKAENESVEAASEEKSPEADSAAEEKPEAEAEPEMKAEVETTDEPATEPTTDDTSAEAENEAVADAKTAVETDTSVSKETADAEPAEPVVEVKVEKKKRHRRTKEEMQAARAEKAAKKAAETAKAEEAPAKDKTETPAAVAEKPLNEDFINSLIYCLGPTYEAFRKSVEERISKINVKPGMAPGVISTMIALNNEVDGLLSFAGDKYCQAYTSIADANTGLIARTKKITELNTKGTQSEKRRAAELAVMNYVYPATGEKVNLLQYANALKQAQSFVASARAYTKSTSIALTMMQKIA